MPFVLAAAIADAALAATSAWHDWRLFSEHDWWVWSCSPRRRSSSLSSSRSASADSALGASIGAGSRSRSSAFSSLRTCLGISLVLGSFSSGHEELTGAQLLCSAGVVLVVNVITFSLVFWEVDCGGPVDRALAPSRATPDFQFPQDENPHLAAPGWAPRLKDYLYLALTNSIAFSPTDAMPLTHRAKLFMGIESLIAAVTVLIVAARAVNIVS